MAFNSFGTHVGIYSATPPTLTDGCHSVALLDINSRLVLDHSSSSIKLGDGTDILDILVEDAASAGDEKGIGVIVVRQDTLATSTSSDGDYALLKTDAKGALWVHGASAFDEDTQHVSGDTGNFILAVRDDGAEATVVYDTVTFTAVTPGTDGNSISLVFDGVDDIDTVVDAWNLANPSNTVTYTGQAGTYVPAGGTAALAGGAMYTEMTDTDGDYSPLSVDKYGRLNVVADLEVTADYAKPEDSAHSSADVGAYVLTVRSDTRPTDANTSADGDYASLFVNANGEVYTHDTDALAKLTEIDTVLDSIEVDTTSIDTTLTNLSQEEDSAHTSTDSGIMSLAVRNDSETSLVDTDGDYAPLQVDYLGRLKTIAEMDHTPGTEEDQCADETGDGLVDGVDETAFVDVVTIPVSAGTTLHTLEIDGSADRLCVFQLVTWDSSQGAGSEIIKYHRKFLVPENVGTTSINFGRAIEVAGGATISVKLQAKMLRSCGSDAVVSGGINAYSL